MKSNSNGYSADATEGFSRLFSTTAMAFEREALRLSKQALMGAPTGTRKRSNGK
ncbi:hypothetical protein [Pseudomonas fluorescens]|uniref:hypothetical protein n=1 Tax=Pseudomonas fluorescens TaxID=294 RepID=UPI00177C0D09|nr:hypothetical protein [Pseudomonas fluorescens]